MFGSDVIDIGIAVVLLFLVTSLICSAVLEIIENFLKVRAMHIERGIREMLFDPEGKLTAEIFDHPLIYGLFGGQYDPSKLAGKASDKWMPRAARMGLPSYIPAASFARALIDLAARGKQGAVGVPQAALSIEQLRMGVAELPSPRLQRIFLNAIDYAQGDLAMVQKNLETWFDTTMDRVSGWYKRRAARLLFVLGFATAVLLNLDVITISERLTADRAMRERFVAAAQVELDAKTAGGAGQTAASTEDIALQRDKLAALGAPIGWEGAWPGPQGKALHCRTGDVCVGSLDLGTGVQVLLGWLVTAFAVTLGAPFWFDILNRFMIVRSTVKPHEKSGEEPGIDRAKGAAAETPAATPPPGAPAGFQGAPVTPPAVSPPLPRDANVETGPVPRELTPKEIAAKAAADEEELY